MANPELVNFQRQYVGARYVPVLANPFEWNAEQVYEPLTIVRYYKSTYTSRKLVPAGTLPTNNEYWALTGDYDGNISVIKQDLAEVVKQQALMTSQINTNVKDIDTLEGDISTLTTQVNNNSKEIVTNAKAIEDLTTVVSKIKYKRNVLIITDSYGVVNAGVEPYTNTVVNVLQNTQNFEHIYVTAKAGAGLSPRTAKSFNSMFDEWCTANNNALNDLTDVYVFGGANDQSLASPSDIPTLVATMMANINAKTPNATFHLGYLSHTYATSELSMKNFPMRNAYQNAITLVGGEYCAGIEYTMVWRELFQSDMVHPNASGTTACARACINAIQGSEYRYTNFTSITAQIPAENSKILATISPFIDGALSIVNFRIAFSTNATFEAGTYSIALENVFPLPGAGVTPEAWVVINGVNFRIWIADGKINIKNIQNVENFSSSVTYGPFKFSDDSLYM